jgi:hypothetical protein
LPLLALAIAFGLAEAGVVLELRAWLDPDGSRFPAITFPQALLRIEQARELATLVLLAAAAALASRGTIARFAAFCVAFGTWDLAYYAVLRLVSGWPRGLGDWDLLFLVPVPWFGPVYAPILIASLLVLCGAAVLQRITVYGGFDVPRRDVAAAVVGGACALSSFLRWDGTFVPPAQYAAAWLGIGCGIGLVGFADAWRANRRTTGAALSAPPAAAPQPPGVASSSADAPTSIGRDAPAPRSRAER